MVNVFQLFRVIETGGIHVLIISNILRGLLTNTFVNQNPSLFEFFLSLTYMNIEKKCPSYLCQLKYF